MERFAHIGSPTVLFDIMVEFILKKFKPLLRRLCTDTGNVDRVISEAPETKCESKEDEALRGSEFESRTKAVYRPPY